MSRRLFHTLAWILLIGGFTLATVIVLALSLPHRSFALSRIRRVSISGNTFLSAPAVLELAGLALEPPRGRVIPHEIARKLQAHRLVHRAQVYRHGDSLIVRLNEHRPYFRLVAPSGKYWLCDDGTVLTMDIEKDHGGIFDELRRGVSLRLASISQAKDPRIVSQLLYAAMRLEQLAPHHFSELRLNTRGDYELVTKHGLSIRLGSDEMLVAKLDVIPQLMRYAGSRKRPLRYVEFKVQPASTDKPARLLALLKYKQ
ncbi:MAG: hypothetical protein B1H03_05130 [Planctomycetales bacterium 4484_113]|nr:MAG: hypothetical protein B1H03_05130 [Planctomycetales bacterium 4484_113]